MTHKKDLSNGLYAATEIVIYGIKSAVDFNRESMDLYICDLQSKHDGVKAIMGAKF